MQRILESGAADCLEMSNPQRRPKGAGREFNTVGSWWTVKGLRRTEISAYPNGAAREGQGGGDRGGGGRAAGGVGQGGGAGGQPRQVGTRTHSKGLSATLDTFSPKWVYIQVESSPMNHFSCEPTLTTPNLKGNKTNL